MYLGSLFVSLVLLVTQQSVVHN